MNSKMVLSKGLVKSVILIVTIVGVVAFCFYVIFSRRTDTDIRTSPAQTSKTKVVEISLPVLEATFEKMESEGWDVKKSLVWGYYFYDHDRKKLEEFSKKLEKNGFHTYKVDVSASNNDEYLLYVYEETVHTPNSLFEQCNKLASLAVDNNIEDFDGWEAGPEPL